jgi:exopolysaccharide/PEP-CTERM locus tyrosine autokinase
MNRIEEAIAKAKAARAREASLAAEREAGTLGTETGPDGSLLVDAEAAEARRDGRPPDVEPRRWDGAGGPPTIARVPPAEPAPVSRVRDTPPPAAAREGDRTLVIEPEALRREGIVPEAADEHRLADEFRVAKRAVLAQLGRKGPGQGSRRVVAVASALPGEGKTFSSFHLAVSLAMERDLNVLLIDADVARPTLSRALGCARCPGLLEFLEGTASSVDETLYRTSVSRLWFLPAGTPTTNAAELLTSPRMPVLLDALATRIGHLLIVMDTPPLLPTVESRAVTDLADQTLLVVKANATPQGAIVRALEQIGHGRTVQLLLNQRRESRLDAYYYYQYPAYPAPDAAPAD